MCPPRAHPWCTCRSEGGLAIRDRSSGAGIAVVTRPVPDEPRFDTALPAPVGLCCHIGYGEGLGGTVHDTVIALAAWQTTDGVYLTPFVLGQRSPLHPDEEHWDVHQAGSDYTDPVTLKELTCPR